MRAIFKFWNHWNWFRWMTFLSFSYCQRLIRVCVHLWECREREHVTFTEGSGFRSSAGGRWYLIPPRPSFSNFFFFFFKSPYPTTFWFRSNKSKWVHQCTLNLTCDKNSKVQLLLHYFKQFWIKKSYYLLFIKRN